MFGTITDILQSLALLYIALCCINTNEKLNKLLGVKK